MIIVSSFKVNDNTISGISTISLEEAVCCPLCGNGIKYRNSKERNEAELRAGTYRPQANRKVEIKKDNGKPRTLQIPSIRDRVVQGVLKLIL